MRPKCNGSFISVAPFFDVRLGREEAGLRSVGLLSGSFTLYILVVFLSYLFIFLILINL